MNVKRYEMEKEVSLDINIIPTETSNGGFVLYEDYAALQQKLDALAAENAALNEMYRQAVKELDDTFFEMGMMAGEKSMEYPAPETSATDAILNGIRAEGITMFASIVLAAAGDLDSTITIERLMLDAEEFVGQLRTSTND